MLLTDIGPKILPFNRKLLQSSEVNVSTDASVATTFTFDSPIYLKEHVLSIV